MLFCDLISDGTEVPMAEFLVEEGVQELLNILLTEIFDYHPEVQTLALDIYTNLVVCPEDLFGRLFPGEK